MVTRALADSVRVFATAIPIALIIGPSIAEQAYVMPVADPDPRLLTVIYTYTGGMKAVVWTELAAGRRSTSSAGSRRSCSLGHLVPGGWSRDPRARRARPGKLQMLDFYTGLDRPHTCGPGSSAAPSSPMASHGTDQLIVQRLLSSRSLKDAQRAIIGSGFVVFLQFVALPR